MSAIYTLRVAPTLRDDKRCQIHRDKQTDYEVLMLNRMDEVMATKLPITQALSAQNHPGKLGQLTSHLVTRSFSSLLQMENSDVSKLENSMINIT